MIPTRKISETILEFGDPLISILPEHFSREEFEGIIMTVVSAWNAVVLDDWNKSTKYTKEYRKVLKQMDNPIATMAEKLIKRKKKKYPHDPRAVGHYEVINRNGEFIFRAEAHLDLKDIDTGDIKH